MSRLYRYLILAVITMSSNSMYAQYSCASAVVLADGNTSSNITSPGTSGSEEWVTAATGTCGSMTGTDFTTADTYIFSYTTGASAGETFNFAIEGPFTSTHIPGLSSKRGGSFSGGVAAQPSIRKSAHATRVMWANPLMSFY